MEEKRGAIRAAGRDLQDAAKDWIAIDGLWFQEIEQVYGMEAAVAMDCRVWERFGAIEAGRIKNGSGCPMPAVSMLSERRLTPGSSMRSICLR